MRLLAVLLIVLPACADNIQPAVPDAAAPPSDATPIADAAADAPVEPEDGPPLRLADTGLYFDFGLQIIHPRNVEYEVQFELWADGASKRRWVRLPPGETIDTSDMDFWSMPVGTVLFKEFSRGGLRVETRMITKRGPGDWEPVTYVWNLAQDDAVLDLVGADDHLGTGHDVPSRTACLSCHDRQPDFVLGFSAIQLDTGDASFGLDELIADGRLSDPPAGPGPVFFPLPGDATDQAALGYLHGNCGGCHIPGGTPVNAELRLEVASLGQVTDTPAYQTTVGVPPQIPIDGATAIIDPGNPDSSAVHIRMGSVDPNIRMPVAGTEEVDTVGLQAVADFITNVPAP